MAPTKTLVSCFDPRERERVERRRGSGEVENEAGADTGVCVLAARV